MTIVNKSMKIGEFKTMYITTNYELKEDKEEGHIIEVRINETNNTVTLNVHHMCEEFDDSIFNMLKKVYKNKKIKIVYKEDISLGLLAYKKFMDIEFRKAQANPNTYNLKEKSMVYYMLEDAKRDKEKDNMVKNEVKKLIEENYIKYRSAIEKYANEYIEFVKVSKKEGIEEKLKIHSKISRDGKAYDIAKFLIDKANDVFFEIETNNKSFFIAIFIADQLDEFYFDNVGDYYNDITFGCHLLYEYNLSDGSLSKL